MIQNLTLAETFVPLSYFFTIWGLIPNIYEREEKKPTDNQAESMNNPFLFSFFFFLFSFFFFLFSFFFFLFSFFFFLFFLFFFSVFFLFFFQIRVKVLVLKINEGFVFMSL